MRKYWYSARAHESMCTAIVAFLPSPLFNRYNTTSWDKYNETSVLADGDDTERVFSNTFLRRNRRTLHKESTQNAEVQTKQRCATVCMVKRKATLALTRWE